MITVCPLPNELEDIPAASCAVQFDQIVRIAFQRRQSGAASFTSTSIKLLATWTPLLAATDITKVVMSPIFAELVIPQSEALTTGGNDNTTFNGIPNYNGEGSVTVTAQRTNLESAVKKALKEMTKYSLASSVGASELTAYLINRNGEIIHNNYKGFPIYNFGISSVGSEGFNSPNKNALRFTFAPDWDDDSLMVKPAFDPLTELV